MPAPTTPVGPAQASVSLAKSMDPGIAKAVGVGFLASSSASAAVTQVTPTSPFPVTVVSGSQTDALTDTELRASPVPVYEDVRQVQTTVFSEFTSVVAASIYASDVSRIGALIFVPEDSQPLHIRWGNPSVSATTRSYTIQPGGAYQVPKDFAMVALYGIMDSAGSAYITQFSLAEG